MGTIKKQTTHNKAGADHSSLLPNLNRTEGQIGGIKKMIQEQRYCPDIVQQVRATRKALIAIEASLIDSHIRCCVRETFENSSEKDKQEKIDEVVKLFKSAISHGAEP